MKNLLLFMLFCLLIACKQEEIENRLKACFTFNRQIEMIRGDTIQFSNCSRKATSYYWNFGDGDTSNLPTPVHVFADTGTYQVFLKAWNETEADSITRAIVILQGNSKPKAGFKDSANFERYYFEKFNTQVGIPIKFSNTSKYATRYLWDLGDGSSTDKADPVHVYTKMGTYKVILHAINEYGEDTVSKIISVDAFRVGTMYFEGGNYFNYFDFDQDSISDLKISTYLHWSSMYGPYQSFISFDLLNGFEVLVTSYIDTTWRVIDTTTVYYYDSVLVPRKFTNMESASFNDWFSAQSIKLIYYLGVTSGQFLFYSGISREYWVSPEEGYVVFRKQAGDEKVLVWLHIRLWDSTHMYIYKYKLFRNVDEVLIEDL